MKIIESKQKEYNKYKQKNSEDSYSKGIVDFSEIWANLMESELEKGNKLEDIADKTSHQADTEGITGFMYGCAVQALSYYWEHGEQLRIWHNLKIQIGTEGEKANKEGGVLNPALLNISSSEEKK